MAGWNTSFLLGWGAMLVSGRVFQSRLVGGFKYLLLCSSNPYLGFHDPIWLAHIFQMGGEKPPTRFQSLSLWLYLSVVFNRRISQAIQQHQRMQGQVKLYDNWATACFLDNYSDVITVFFIMAVDFPIYFRYKNINHWYHEISLVILGHQHGYQDVLHHKPGKLHR